MCVSGWVWVCVCGWARSCIGACACAGTKLVVHCPWASQKLVSLLQCWCSRSSSSVHFAILDSCVRACAGTKLAAHCPEASQKLVRLLQCWCPRSSCSVHFATLESCVHACAGTKLAAHCPEASQSWLVCCNAGAHDLVPLCILQL